MIKPAAIGADIWEFGLDKEVVPKFKEPPFPTPRNINPNTRYPSEFVDEEKALFTLFRRQQKRRPESHDRRKAVLGSPRTRDWWRGRNCKMSTDVTLHTIG
jgi:hypothetical protein